MVFQGKVDNSEYISIFNELKRLRQIFTDHYAFHNYSSKLIEIMAYLRPEIIQIDYSEFPTRYDLFLNIIINKYTRWQTYY
jgi:hypothetical protein